MKTEAIDIQKGFYRKAFKSIFKNKASFEIAWENDVFAHISQRTLILFYVYLNENCLKREIIHFLCNFPNFNKETFSYGDGLLSLTTYHQSSDNAFLTKYMGEDNKLHLVLTDLGDAYIMDYLDRIKRKALKIKL